MPTSNTIQLSVEDALSNIDNALSQLNGNRQTHMVLQVSVERVREELISLNTRLLTQSTEVSALYEARIKELEARIAELSDNPPVKPPPLM